MKHIVVAYRDNNQYSLYLPRFLDVMKSDGWDVQQLVVPSITSDEQANEIAAAYIRDRFVPGGYCLTDRTCRPANIHGLYPRDFGFNVLSSINDSFFEMIFAETLNSNTTAEALEFVLEKLHRARTVENVYLVERYIDSHLEGNDGSRFHDDSGRLDPAISPEEVRANLQAKVIEVFTDSVKKLFPDATVVRVPTYYHAVNAVSDPKKSLIIVDRHDQVFREDRVDPQSEHLCVLPPSGAAERLIAAGKLEFEFTARDVYKTFNINE